jgi:hypothetical protein
MNEYSLYWKSKIYVVDLKRILHLRSPESC